MSPISAVRYLRDHGMRAWVHGAATVAVVEVSTYRGQTYEQIVYLPSSLPGIRDWLGY